MKKTLALILSALLLLSAFTSCSKKPRIEETEEETKVEATIGDGDNNNNGDNNNTNNDNNDNDDDKAKETYILNFHSYREVAHLPYSLVDL